MVTNQELSYFLETSPFKNLTDLANYASARYPKEWFYKPLGIEIELTSSCNISCVGCILPPKNQTLDIKRVLDFLQQASTAGVLYYTLTGGEPFLFFQEIKQIIAQAPLDLLKINTNGFAFSEVKATYDLLEELLKSGMVKNNKYLRPGLYLSQGQQNSQGIPVENAINLLLAAILLPDPRAICLTFALFHPDRNLAKKIDREFWSLVDKNLIPLDKLDLAFLDIANTVLCSTAIHLNYHSTKLKSIEELVRTYTKKVNNCSPNQEQFKMGRTGTRMLLRANGDIFSCMGFSHVFKLGNIYEDTFVKILERANSNQALRAVFVGGLAQLFEHAKQQNPQIGKKMVSVLNGPCNICQELSGF